MKHKQKSFAFAFSGAPSKIRLPRASKGFTLIELLVVVAIFGLLASVLVVSIKSSRERSSVAAGLQFSGTLQRSLGADAVGMWGFDEGSGTTAKDSSGNDNNATLHNGPIWVTNGIIKGALEFDGINDYVEIPDSQAKIVSEFKDAFTIEAWVYLDSTTNWRALVSKSTSVFYLMVKDDAILFCAAGLDLRAPAVIKSGKWYHIAATFGPEGSGELNKKMRIYLNGKEAVAPKSDIPYIATLSSSNTDPIFIGAFGYATPLYYYLDGKIDEVRIYKRNLTSAEIQKHYAEGAAKKGLAVNE